MVEIPIGAQFTYQLHGCPPRKGPFTRVSPPESRPSGKAYVWFVDPRSGYRLYVMNTDRNDLVLAAPPVPETQFHWDPKLALDQFGDHLENAFSDHAAEAYEDGFAAGRKVGLEAAIAALTKVLQAEPD